MSIKFIYFGFFLVATMFLSGCNQNSIVNQVEDISQPWIAADKVSFAIDIQDTLKPFDFFISVRNDVDYEYSNLFLFMKTTFPDGRYAVDTINIWLAQPDGKWIGRGFGKYRDTDALFRSRGRFPMKGVYHFEFEQAMRNLELYGITSLGIRIDYGKE